MRLRKLRELDLREPPQSDRPAHLSAASGLVRAGKFLYVVADDEHHLGIFPASGKDPGLLLRLRSGKLPDSYAKRKAKKPDLEALTLLPPFADYPCGALLAIGSGSRPNRRTGFLMKLDTHGAVISTPYMIDLEPMFAAMEPLVADINIEGATVSGERLRFLQRGNKRKGRNAIIDFSLAEFLHSLRSGHETARADVLKVSQFDLGVIDDVPLSFSDGASLPDGSLIFTAIAEDTVDSYADGSFLGAAIGRISAQDEITVLHELLPPLKIEGVDAHVGDGVIRLMLTTDADDAAVPASLYETELPSK